MDWQKVVEELDRLSDESYKEAYTSPNSPFQQIQSRGPSGFIFSEEMDKINARSQLNADHAFLLRSFANALRKGLEQ